MSYTVVKLSQLATVPAIGSTYEVTGDALQLVDVVASALRTNFQVGLCILVATVQTAVAVVVYRTVSHIVLIHHVNHTGNDRRVVGSIAVNLYIEDVSTTSQIVIRSLHLLP